MQYRLFLFLFVYTIVKAGSPSILSQKFTQLDRDLRALEQEDLSGWLSGRASILEQVNAIIREGFYKQAVPLFQRIHKRDDRILEQLNQTIKNQEEQLRQQSTQPKAIITEQELVQLKRDKKSLKTVTERQSLTLKNMEKENKKSIDAFDQSEKNLHQARESLETTKKEVERLKQENESLAKELQQVQIFLKEKSLSV